jgi:hypothetical protein
VRNNWKSGHFSIDILTKQREFIISEGIYETTVSCMFTEATTGRKNAALGLRIAVPVVDRIHVDCALHHPSK